MVKVTFRTANGKTFETDEPAGSSAMRAAVNAGVPGIDADCGGACSCATCHVKVVDKWIDQVGSAGETERDMLEFETHTTEHSRLSCQIRLTEDLNGLELEVVPRD